jgi:hypothetical protein
MIDPFGCKNTQTWKRSMEVDFPDLNSRLKVKMLKDFGINVPMWLIKPSHELKQLSMRINPIPYLLRASRRFAFINDNRAILFKKQNFKCVYCKDKLLEFDCLNKYSIECDTILYGFGINIISGFEEYTKVTFSNKHKEPNWYYSFHVDYLIPKFFAGNVLSCKKLFDHIRNKVVIHYKCFKLKIIVNSNL